MNRISKNNLKRELQNWIDQEWKWSHFITVEPTPSLPFTEDEISQRLRIIRFYLNKKYLKSSFSKWDEEDLFWFVGFKEGFRILGNIHYHFMLHSPSKVYRNKDLYSEAYVTKDILERWANIPSINPYTGEIRQGNFGALIYDRKLPISRKNQIIGYQNNTSLSVELVENSAAVVMYCSKHTHAYDGFENLILI